MIKRLHIIQQTLKAPKNQRNNFGNYNYRSCEDILEAVKPLLEEDEAITLTDSIINVGNKNYVEGRATFHKKEGTIFVNGLAREAETKKGMDDAQITGSASSYARKYALNGLFAIDDTKDSDTMDNSPQKATQAPVTNVAPKADPKPLITDPELTSAIKAMLENNTINKETPVAKIIGYLEMKYELNGQHILDISTKVLELTNNNK